MEREPSEERRLEAEIERLRERNAQLEARQHRLEQGCEARGPRQPVPGQLRRERAQKEFAQDELARKVEELEQANAHLRELDQMKGNFLSLLSHELRTPLSAILGYISILDDELAGPVPEAQHQYLKQIQGEADKLLAVINNLLDMNRLESGQMTFEHRPVDLSEVVQNVLGRAEVVLVEKDLHLAQAVSEDLPILLTDEQRLGQILSNLLNNAIKFTPAGGNIWVRGRQEGATLLLEVEDTGIGISPEDLPLLFQVFGQLDTSSTRIKGGLGLGLALAKGLAEAMGGSIGVSSVLGKGSIFWVRLPVRGAAD